jgi:hypothetical protein
VRLADEPAATATTPSRFRLANVTLRGCLIRD